MTPIEVLRERVERCAAFLDEHEPICFWNLLDSLWLEAIAQRKNQGDMA